MKDFILMYPCHDGWDSQGNHDGGACDIGWDRNFSTDGRTDIYAAADGVVEFEGWYAQRYNNTNWNTIAVLIRHTNLDPDYDIVSVYWHLSSTFVNKGDIVKRGQVIGKKGNTGNSKGVHLHFQLLKLAKGAAIPNNYTGAAWTKISLYPVPYMRQFPGTYFKSVGNWTLKPYEPEKDIPKPVPKNNLVNQVSVTCDGLRVRTEPNTTSEIAGVYEHGYYNAEKVNEKWLKVGEFYMGIVEGVTYIPASIIPLEEKVKELEAKVEELNKIIEQLNKEKEELERKEAALNADIYSIKAITDKY